MVQVACGDAHTLVVTEGGELYSFGRNQNGQLGLGHSNDGPAPQRVEALRVRAVRADGCRTPYLLDAAPPHLLAAAQCLLSLPPPPG